MLYMEQVVIHAIRFTNGGDTGDATNDKIGVAHLLV